MPRMTRRFRKLLVASTALVILSGCEAGPRTRPVPTNPVEGTTAAARKELEGQWVLVSLRVTAADGRQSDIEATGSLDVDQYSVVQIEYRMSDAGLKALAAIGINYPNPVISTKGRAAIDVQHRQITYVDKELEQKARDYDRDVAARRANPFALERVRHYTIDPDGLLILSTRYDDGKDAMVSRWKRSA
jgi:hypothetical protein